MISEAFDAFVCDLDGVLYRGRVPIPGAAEAVARLRSSGHRFLFCTNNSRATVEQYVQKLGGMDIPATHDEILTSATVTGELLSSRNPEGLSVYLVGGEGIKGELEDRGMKIVDDPEAVDAVVVGADPDFTYAKMQAAADAVRAGSIFVATNADPSFPGSNGLFPGAGAVLAGIEVASGRRAEVVGKPHRPMMEAAARRLEGCNAIAAIGDQPITDLDGARTMGWATILVLSGVTTKADAERLETKPDYVVDTIADVT
jgi:4-nitrophenyl phosphatase